MTVNKEKKKKKKKKKLYTGKLLRSFGCYAISMNAFRLLNM